MKPTLGTLAVGKRMAFQGNTHTETVGEPGQAGSGLAGQRERKGTTRNSRSISAMEMAEGGVCSTSEQLSGSLAVIFYFEERR